MGNKTGKNLNDKSDKFLKLSLDDRLKLLNLINKIDSGSITKNKKSQKTLDKLIDNIDLSKNNYEVFILINGEETIVDLNYRKDGSYVFVNRFYF